MLDGQDLKYLVGPRAFSMHHPTCSALTLSITHLRAGFPSHSDQTLQVVLTQPVLMLQHSLNHLLTSRLIRISPTHF